VPARRRGGREVLALRERLRELTEQLRAYKR